MTEESMFKAFKDKGLTVFVGESKFCCAQYYLKDIDEVAKFLSMIMEVKKNEANEELAEG